MIFDEGRQRKWDLMRVRQPGTTSEHDSRQVVTETFRRLKATGEDEEPAKVSVFAKPRKPSTGNPPDEPEPIDRFHKSADEYITVAKPHSITSDPIRLPGQFEFIQEAIDHAEANIIPNFTGDERVVIEIHGGLYVEDLTISYDRIDLHGIGMPHIQGLMTFDMTTPSHWRGAHQMFSGLHLDGVDVYALDLPRFADIDPGLAAPFARPHFFKCWIHSESTAVRIQGKTKFYECYLWMDADGVYGNLSTPTVKIYAGSHTYWTEFYRCVIAGAVDDRLPAPPVGFPNTGMAWHTISKNDPGVIGYFNYVDSGVVFRNTTIEGWGYNECWQVLHDRCYLYGGYVDGAFVGETYCFNSGDSSIALRGKVFFDLTEAACRYLVEESDMTPGVAANTTDTYLRLFDQLSNGSAYAGSMIVAGVTPFGGSQAISGTTYAKQSATYREWFNAIFGPAEGAILLNCDSDTAHYAANGFAFPSGGIVQTICLNPYKDG